MEEVIDPFRVTHKPPLLGVVIDFLRLWKNKKYFYPGLFKNSHSDLLNILSDFILPLVCY